MKHVVALSGGKDSTAMALRLKELHPSIDYEYVITPTYDELPEMKAHWERLERLLGKKLISVNTMTLKECIEREQMIPNFQARFCTRILKIEPMIDYMNTLPKGSIMYVGLRADENERLGLEVPGNVFLVLFPMQEWGWTVDDVWSYLDFKGIAIPKRTDCGACFFQRLEEWKDLLDNHPWKYEEYVQIEKKMGHTFRSPGRDTWPASLAALRVEFWSGRKLRKSKPRKEKKCRFCSM